MVKRASWLSVTPEPERELPVLVATLERGGPPSPDAVAAEATRVERLVLHGSRRSFNRYLHRVVGLIEARLADPQPEVARARERAMRVIANHHNLLLALPGAGARHTETDRRRLAQLLAVTTSEDLP